MGSKTLIPAFKAHVGDWNYYVCLMKYAQVAQHVDFAYELGTGNKDLNRMVQRGLTNRTGEIEDYLLHSEHRFLGSLIVAVWGGDPKYLPLAMQNEDEYMEGVDREFGVLTFDGTQSYFALDGQHRLRAIKDAVKQNPVLGGEDISVLLVPHFDTEEGKDRTRRLFTNINRNAKPTTPAENIALDVDDGFAVVTRDLLQHHPFLSKKGVVRVFGKPPTDEGELVLARGNVPQADPAAWTTITVLYDLLKELRSGLDPAMEGRTKRPSEDVLTQSYEVLAGRIDDLLKSCGDLQAKLDAAASARDVRAPKNAEGRGHAFMRPVVQKAVAKVLHQILDQKELTWEEAMSRLSELDWTISGAPWNAVWTVTGPDRGKMNTGKELTDLLADLLYVHLAPGSLQKIKKARRTYRDLKNAQYPIKEEELAVRLKAGGEEEAPPAS
jgi:DNA sulfur modification protein DndB